MPRPTSAFVSFLASVAAVCGFLPGVSRAGEIEDAVRPGEYHGIWHTDKVKFLFEKVGRDGHFTGVVRFDKDSRFPNATFVFNGKVEPGGAIVIHRDPANDPQMARAGTPRREGGFYVWKGVTTGADIPDNPP